MWSFSTCATVRFREWHFQAERLVNKKYINLGYSSQLKCFVTSAIRTSCYTKRMRAMVYQELAPSRKLNGCCDRYFVKIEMSNDVFCYCLFCHKCNLNHWSCNLRWVSKRSTMRPLSRQSESRYSTEDESLCGVHIWLATEKTRWTSKEVLVVDKRRE